MVCQYLAGEDLMMKVFPDLVFGEKSIADASYQHHGDEEGDCCFDGHGG
jgi:hypothetical protein